MRKLRNANVAWICILCVLHLMSMDFVSATTNPGYGGATLSGRPSIAVISGGASGLQVNTLLGNLSLPTADLAIPARGLPFEIKPTYNSVDHTTPGPFGFGWDFCYCLDYFPLANGNIILAWGDGRTDLFVLKAGAYTPANEGVYATLEQYQTDQFRVTTKEGLQYFFDNPVHRHVTRILDPNGNALSFTYDSSLQLTSVTDASARSLFFSYTKGKLTTITDPNASPARTLHYAYDAFGNQVRFTDPLGYVTRYAYDAAGNRTQASAGGVLTTYAYDDGNQLTQESTASTTTTYAYDANGNQIQEAMGASTSTSTYDVRDRVVGFTSPTTTSSYTYDALDRRIEKSVGGTQTRWSYDGLDAVAEYDGSGTLQAQNLFGPGLDENLARYTASGSLYYLHDGLNSVRTIVDATQSVLNSYDYDAWGNIVSQVATVVNDYTFTGRPLDRESGLYYNRARLYNPLNGRFTQAIADVLGRSPFAYVANNPVNRVAPLGVGWWIAGWILIAVVAIVVAIVAAIIATPVALVVAAIAIVVAAAAIVGLLVTLATGDADLGLIAALIVLVAVILLLIFPEIAIPIVIGIVIIVVIVVLIAGAIALVSTIARRFRSFRGAGGGGNPGGINPGGGNGANAPDRKGVDGGFAQANAGNRRNDTNLAGGGTFVGGANQKSVIAICSVAGLADSTAPTPTSLGSLSNATDLSGSLEIYNFATRTLIDAVSFTSIQGSFANGAANLSITGTADVNGTPTNFRFSETEAGGVISYEMQNSDTSAVLAEGTGEAARSTFALRIGF